MTNKLHYRAIAHFMCCRTCGHEWLVSKRLKEMAIIDIREYCPKCREWGTAEELDNDRQN